jgi:hypothetical protein
MTKSEREKLAVIFKETSVPAGLEQRVLFAVKSAQHQEEILSRRFWAIGLTVSTLAVTVGLATGWQAISTSGIFEIVQTAVANFNAIRPTDMLWGLMENLPFGSLALIFGATTALGWLASLKKQERQHILHLKFI